MRRSHVILGFIILASVGSLVPFGALRPESNHILMTVWGMPFEDRLFRDHYARGFEVLHPQWRVEYQRYQDVNPKYNAWHVHGYGADVMRVGIDNYHAYVAKGMLLNLDAFIEDSSRGLSDDDIADFFPHIWTRLKLDTGIYALPSDNAQYGLFYNKAAFDEYNRANPDDPLPYPDESWRWADLSEAAKRLEIRDGDGRAIRYGMMFDIWAWPFLAFLHQAGGRTWDDDETTTLINSEAGVEALTYLVSLVPPDAPIRSQELAASAASPAELFKTGRLAMMLDGSWRIPNVEIDAPDLDFAVTSLPRHRERAIVSGSVLWAISSHARHPEIAWEMIRWMTGQDQSVAYWNMLRVAPPPRRSVLESDVFRTTTGIVDEDGTIRVPPMHAEMFVDRAAWLAAAITPDPQTGRIPGFVPAAPYQSDLQGKITRALTQATRGEMTPREALDAAVRDVHAVIDRDRAAKGLPPVPR